MTTAKKAFFLYRDWCIAKYLREDANWSNYPEIFVSAWEYAWNDGFDTVSHESIYTNKNASRYLVGGMVDKDDEGSYSEPAPSPTMAVPLTMLRRNSITGYCSLLR